jgi:hypothetical protein
MHPSNTHLKRWRLFLVAIIVLAAVPFAVSATRPAAAKPPVPGPSSARNAKRSYPAAPAGPRGPIELTCAPGRAGVVGSDGPAGPQGPVGVNCAPALQR